MNSQPQIKMFGPRMVLGTVQLGLVYGVANTSGRPDQRMATEIIQTAWRGKIREFDTAQDYGESEIVLGIALKAINAVDARVITKLSASVDLRNPLAVIESIKGSLVRLGLERLHAVLLHHEKMLSTLESDVQNGLYLAKKSGLLKHIGISVYSPEIGLRALTCSGVTSIQIPANVFDHRFRVSGFMEQAQEKGIIVYIRSAYLQGLILMNPEKIPSSLQAAIPLVKLLNNIASEAGLTTRELALGYILSRYSTANVLFGAETSQQVSENLTVPVNKIDNALCNHLEQVFKNVPIELVRPDLWPRNG